MPPRFNLIDDLFSILTSPRRAAPPGRSQLRPADAPSASAASAQVDLEALAQRLAARPGDQPAAVISPTPAPTPAAPDYPARNPEAVRTKLQRVEPYLRAGGEPPPAQGGQRNPLVQVPGQRGSGQFVAGQRVPFQNLASRTSPPTTAPSPNLPPRQGRNPNTLPVPVRTPEVKSFGARMFLQDHLGYQPAGDPVAWARRFGLTSPETYRSGTAQPHPTMYRTTEDLALGRRPEASPARPTASNFPADVLQRAFGQRENQLTSTDTTWLTTSQRRALARSGFSERWANNPQALQTALNEMNKPITAEQMQRRLAALDRASTGRAVTPSRAAQTQTGGARTLAAQDFLANYRTPETAQWLARHASGTTPEKFNYYYFGGLVQRPQVYTTGETIHLSGALHAPVDFTVRGRDGRERTVRQGTYLGSITRTISPGTRSAYNNYFALSDSAQGLGIAKVILRNQIAIYRRMGLDKVTVSAGRDGGGHTWARFGFLPSADGWARLQPQILERLNRINGLDPAYKADVIRLIRTNDPRALRMVAKLGMTPGANAPTGSKLGQRLLRGLGWSGTLDLRDAETMRHFDEYVRDAPSGISGPAPALPGTAAAAGA